jgi:hypothetical protein
VSRHFVYCFGDLPSGARSPFDFFCSHRPGLRTTLGHATNRAETLQAAYNSSE